MKSYEQYLRDEIKKEILAEVDERIKESIDFGYDGDPLTPEEFHAKIGGKVSLRTIYDQARTGIIKKVPELGDRVLIPRTELKRFFEGKRN